MKYKLVVIQDGVEYTYEGEDVYKLRGDVERIIENRGDEKLYNAERVSLLVKSRTEETVTRETLAIHHLL